MSQMGISLGKFWLFSPSRTSCSGVMLCGLDWCKLCRPFFCCYGVCTHARLWHMGPCILSHPRDEALSSLSLLVEVVKSLAVAVVAGLGTEFTSPLVVIVDDDNDNVNIKFCKTFFFKGQVQVERHVAYSQCTFCFQVCRWKSRQTCPPYTRSMIAWRGHWRNSTSASRPAFCPRPRNFSWKILWTTRFRVFYCHCTCFPSRVSFSVDLK